MDLNFYSMPVSLLRQHCFCPRIPYFYLVRELEPVAKQWVREGSNYHERMQTLIKRRVLTHYGISEPVTLKLNVGLRSEALGLHGISDCVLVGQSQCYPVEFKQGKYRPGLKGIQMQLVAYAMLCEFKFKLPATKAFVINPQDLRPHVIKITDADREMVKKLISEIQNNCQQALVPHSAASEVQCSQCEFLNFC